MLLTRYRHGGFQLKARLLNRSSSATAIRCSAAWLADALFHRTRSAGGVGVIVLGVPARHRDRKTPKLSSLCAGAWVDPPLRGCSACCLARGLRENHTCGSGQTLYKPLNRSSFVTFDRHLTGTCLAALLLAKSWKEHLWILCLDPRVQSLIGESCSPQACVVTHSLLITRLRPFCLAA
mgnify:CR=1 FL=1